MASNRHLGRIVALQSLYEYDFREDKPADIKQITMRNLGQYEDVIDDTDFVLSMTEKVLDNIEKIDAIIAPAAPEWPIDQIARVDRTILRMAIFELIVESDTPPKVVINEAVELGKRFGSDNSSKFINGVLGTVYREHIGEKPESSKSEEEDESQQ